MKANRNIAAFTLIEILITIVILSTGIVVILHAFETSMMALTKARDVLACTVLCRDKLSEIKSDIAVGKSPEATSNGSFDGMYEDYRWNTESSLLPRKVKDNSSKRGSDKDDGVKIDLYKVEVSVWRNGYPDDGQRTVTFLKL